MKCLSFLLLPLFLLGCAKDELQDVHAEGNSMEQNSACIPIVVTSHTYQNFNQKYRIFLELEDCYSVGMPKTTIMAVFLNGTIYDYANLGTAYTTPDNGTFEFALYFGEQGDLDRNWGYSKKSPPYFIP